MKRVLYFFIFFITINSFSQTKAGIVQFNDVDFFDGHELILNGAGERDKFYALGLYLDLDFDLDELEDGVKVAENDATMALTLKITSGTVTKEEWTDLIRNGIERATDGNSYLFEDQIRDFENFLPEEINRFDIFKIVYFRGGSLSLYKNKTLLGSLNDLDFKQALFKIWLGENPVDQGLKDDLLGSVDPNPILGRWKTYDRKTGVAISIIQVYMIENKVYGAIERMMRHSERDDICYHCEGENKNQKVEGLVILKKFKPKTEDKYTGGKYTDVRTGKTTEGQIWIDEDNKDLLKLKYKGGGGVHQWKRVKQ